MSMDALESFRAMVLADPLLLDQIRQAPDEAALAQLAVRLGAARGFSFTADEVLASLRQDEGLGTEQLTDQQLEAVAGGARQYAPPLR